MTVPTLNSIAEFATNGVTTNFPFFFKFLANEDLVVTYVDPLGVSSVLVLGSQYTVNGAGDEGGSVVTTTALAGPGQLIVSREMDAYQQTSLRNQGKFLAETHEDVFDKLTMLIQQGFSFLGRALLRPFGKSYYDAEGRNISNLADPVADQDAATKGWSGRYFGDLIDGATGLINTTTGILYDAGTLFDYLRYGVGRTVDSISALRLLSSARNQRAFVLGYYVKGDGGGGAYFVDPADTTSADNGGSVIVAADGARWKLSARKRVSVLQFGAKNDSSFDSYAAIQAAHNAFESVDYPSGGNFRSSQRVIITGAFGLRGAGVNKTVVTFYGATQGYFVTQQNSSQGIVVDGVSLKTTSAVTSTIGLLVDGTPQLGISDGAGHLILNDRTSKRISITNVDCRGVNDSTGWGVNIQLKSVMNFMLEDITYRGVIPALPTGPVLGVGVLVNGDGVPTDWSIRRIWGYYSLYGILMPDYTEGGHIYDYEFVAVGFGIVGRYTPGYSVLPAPACGCLSMYIDQGHLNILNAGVILDKTNQNHISNLNIYFQSRAADAQTIALQLISGNWNTIENIFINGSPALNTKSNNLGVVLTNVGLSNISNVSAQEVTSSVTMIDATENTIDNCTAAFCTYAVNGNGGSTGNRIANIKGKSLTSTKVSVASDNNIVMDEFATVVTQAFTGTATAVIQVALPSGLFTAAPTFASIIPNSGTIAFNFQYLRSTSTATLARFFVTPQPPASVLPTGSIDFSVNVKGL